MLIGNYCFCLSKLWGSVEKIFDALFNIAEVRDDRNALINCESLFSTHSNKNDLAFTISHSAVSYIVEINGKSG